MAVNGLNHLTIGVTDLTRSIDFYANVLGLRLEADWPGGAYLTAGDLWLCLERQERVDVDADDGSHIAFNVAPAAFEGLCRRITERGAEVWKDNKSEGASHYFLDPDGRRLEIHVGDLQSRLAHYRAHPEKGVTVYGDG